MKRFLVLLAVMALATSAFAVPEFVTGDSEFGIFTTATPTSEADAALAVFPGYAVLNLIVFNPMNVHTGAMMSAIGGYEFGYVLPAGFTSLAFTTPGGINVGNGSDVIMGVASPGCQVIAGQCNLGTWTIIGGGVGGIRVNPITGTNPSIAGNLALADLTDGLSLSPMYPISGSFSEPVFGIGQAVVPTDEASWGEVKSLFR